MKVAIFDFDGTLIPDETFPLLMKHFKTHPIHNKKYRKFIMRLLPAYVAAKCRLYPQLNMNKYAMKTYLSSLGSVSDKELEYFFSDIGDWMRQNLSENIIERLEQHRQDGYYIMLVSGAYEQLLAAVMKDIPFDSIVGTRVWNNTIDYINGHRKKEVILETLADKDVDWENSFAYGDSFSDLHALELVGKPVAVKPDERLLEAAKERNWEVIGGV